MQFITGLKTLGVCLVLGTFAACGGGGSGGSGNSGNGANGGANPTGNPGGGVRRPDPGTISGVAHDGPISGATINVYEWNGQRGRLLISTVTDSAGQYSLNLRAPRQPVLLESIGGMYVEEATESNVIISSEQALFAVQNFDPEQALTSHITYFSTLAAGLAEHLVRMGSPTDEAVTTANTRIAGILGLDLSRAPAIINNQMSEPADVTESVDLGFATAAVSSLTQSVSIANDTQPHTLIKSIGFIQSAFDDIRTDGLLDGRGTNGPITLGKVSVTTDTYRRQLALNILKVAANPTANRLQINPAQLVAIATRLNASTDPIFANAPVTPIDTDKPNILDLSIGDGEVLFGRGRKIAFSIQSLSALASVQLLLDNAVAVAMVDPNAMSATLDTTQFPDGQFDFALVVTDVAGATVRKTFTVTIANMTATVVSNTLRDNQFYNGVFDAQFAINDPAGIGMVQYLVDDVVQQTQTNSDPFRFDTRRFADGSYTVLARVTNIPGAITEKAIGINIDNTPPSVTFSLADNTFTNQGAFNLTISATDTFMNTIRLPNVADPAAFLLDGRNNPTPPTDISVAGNSVTFNQSIASLPEGIHTFSFMVSDAINSTIISRRFTVDRTPPVATFTAPETCFSSATFLGCTADNTARVSGIVTLKGSLKDLSPITQAELRFIRVQGLTAGNVRQPIDLTPRLAPDGSFSVDVDTTSISNGEVRFSVSGTDALGNFGSGGIPGFLIIAN